MLAESLGVGLSPSPITRIALSLLDELCSETLPSLLGEGPKLILLGLRALGGWCADYKLHGLRGELKCNS